MQGEMWYGKRDAPERGRSGHVSVGSRCMIFHDEGFGRGSAARGDGCDGLGAGGGSGKGPKQGAGRCRVTWHARWRGVALSGTPPQKMLAGEKAVQIEYHFPKQESRMKCEG